MLLMANALMKTILKIMSMTVEILLLLLRVEMKKYHVIILNVELYVELVYVTFITVNINYIYICRYV